MAMNSVLQGMHHGHPFRSIVEVIKWWIQKDWQVQISHVYKDDNVLVDCLASLAHDYDLICIFFR